MTFQSTHPRGVRQLPYFCVFRRTSFQSTHPRGVRRRAVRPLLQHGQVSIHAPARGATWQRMALIGAPPGVSIHAPARGATDVRRDRRCRHEVSIHAPARGATHRHNQRVRSSRGFNPRTREGCDALHYLHQRDIRVSIHAPARGATDPGPQAVQHLRRFNPRTREGCDAASVDRWTGPRSFNPRTREGCDDGALGDCS